MLAMTLASAVLGYRLPCGCVIQCFGSQGQKDANEVTASTVQRKHSAVTDCRSCEEKFDARSFFIINLSSHATFLFSYSPFDGFLHGCLYFPSEADEAANRPSGDSRLPSVVLPFKVLAQPLSF